MQRNHDFQKAFWVHVEKSFQIHRSYMFWKLLQDWIEAFFVWYFQLMLLLKLMFEVLQSNRLMFQDENTLLVCSMACECNKNFFDWAFMRSQCFSELSSSRTQNSEVFHLNHYRISKRLAPNQYLLEIDQGMQAHLWTLQRSTILSIMKSQKF